VETMEKNINASNDFVGKLRRKEAIWNVYEYMGE
jgi:hypothetical protein